MTMYLTLVTIVITISLTGMSHAVQQFALASTADERLTSIELSETQIPTESIMSGNVTSESLPNIVFLDEDSGILKYGKSSYWQDYGVCAKVECSQDSTTGFNDNSSVKISIPLTYEGRCLQQALPCSFTWLYGGEISVRPGASYDFITHMQLNDHVVGSHIGLQGFNETSQKWFNISHCPTGTDGPLDWKAFNCQITIPENVDTIRPILYNGWSSSPTNPGITWYDDVYIISNDTANDNNLVNPLFVR